MSSRAIVKRCPSKQTGAIAEGAVGEANINHGLPRQPI